MSLAGHSRVSLAGHCRMSLTMGGRIRPRIVGCGDRAVGVVDGGQRGRGVDLGMLGGRVVGGRCRRVERLALGSAGVVVVVLVLVGGGGHLADLRDLLGNLLGHLLR